MQQLVGESGLDAVVQDTTKDVARSFVSAYYQGPYPTRAEFFDENARYAQHSGQIYSGRKAIKSAFVEFGSIKKIVITTAHSLLTNNENILLQITGIYQMDEDYPFAEAFILAPVGSKRYAISSGVFKWTVKTPPGFMSNSAGIPVDMSALHADNEKPLRTETPVMNGTHKEEPAQNSTAATLDIPSPPSVVQEKAEHDGKAENVARAGNDSNKDDLNKEPTPSKSKKVGEKTDHQKKAGHNKQGHKNTPPVNNGHANSGGVAETNVGAINGTGNTNANGVANDVPSGAPPTVIHVSGFRFHRKPQFKALLSDLTQHFSQFGPIAYVTIPKRILSNDVPVYAFVEFVHPETAAKIFSRKDPRNRVVQRVMFNACNYHDTITISEGRGGKDYGQGKNTGNGRAPQQNGSIMQNDQSVNTAAPVAAR
uniref:NTF2 domain-containing protein n=1 Tax=Panagrolaimus sp. JU765 TaxID=591449 RepID=A0AC34QJQ0_9BILA